MKTLKERLIAIIDESGLNRSAFAREIGIKPSSLGSYIQEKSSMPSSEVIATIALKFPQFNITWLLTGQGEMYNAGFERPKKSEGSSETVEELRAAFESMRQEMDTLNRNMRWVMNQLNGSKQDLPLEVGKAKAKVQVREFIPFAMHQ